MLPVVWDPRFWLLWPGVDFINSPEHKLDEDALELSLEPSYSLSQYAEAIQAAPTKNVMIFLIEALRSDVIGKVVEGIEITPNLNNLAKEGFFFPKTYSHSAETSYAQLTAVLGQHPYRYPYLDTFNTIIDYPVFRSFDLFAKLGYQTAYVLADEWVSTKRVTAASKLDLSFEAARDPIAKIRKYLTSDILDLAEKKGRLAFVQDLLSMKTIKEWAGEVREGKGQFFVSSYLVSSHFPYRNFAEMEPVFNIAGEPIVESFLSYPPESKDTMWKMYLNTLHFIDGLIGDLIDGLRQKGLLENSLVVITGDHGQAFHEHGQVCHNGRLYESLIRVPLIIYGAHGYAPRQPVEMPASHLDILPTVLRVLDLPEIAAYQGRSLLIKEGEEPPLKDCPRPIISTNQLLYEDAVIHWPWKLISSNQTHRNQLFNLAQDPEEKNNLELKESAIRDKLKAYLSDFRQRQFSYYLGPPSRRARYFPPALACLE